MAIIPVPAYFRRKEKTGPLFGTYPMVVLALDWRVSLSTYADQVAAMPLRNVIGAYTGEKMAVARSKEALLNADLSPSEKTPIIEGLTKEEEMAKELRLKIGQHLEKSKEEVEKLPELVFEQVKIDLNLVEAPTEVAPEKNVSAQLLADKNTVKEERQQKKEQEREINMQSKDFCKKSETRKLEDDESIKNIKGRVDELNKIATNLEEKAKPKEVEGVVQKQIPPELMAKELGRSREEPSSARVPGLGDDSMSQ